LAGFLGLRTEAYLFTHRVRMWPISQICVNSNTSRYEDDSFLDDTSLPNKLAMNIFQLLPGMTRGAEPIAAVEKDQNKACGQRSADTAILAPSCAAVFCQLLTPI
jgi:hypothetical protein